MVLRGLTASAFAAVLASADLTIEAGPEDEASLLQRKAVENKKMRMGNSDCANSDGLRLNLATLEDADNTLHLASGTGTMVFRDVHPEIENVNLEISIAGGGAFPETNPSCPADKPPCDATSPYCPANAANNKLHGEFVQFSMLCGAANDQHSWTKLKFKLKQGENDAAMNLDQFVVSVYDVDEGVDSETGARQGQETVTACGADAYHMPLREEHLTEGLNIAELEVNELGNGCTQVMSTTFGNKHNNPTSRDLDADQAKRTVDFVFNGVNEAELTFSLSHCKCGRNLLFAFTPAVSCLLPPVTTPAPEQPQVAPQLCTAIGDPHLKPFDKTHGSLPMYDDGDFWLIQTDELKVQARNWAKHWRGQASMKAMAISGSFLGNKVLILDGPSEKVQLDHVEIMQAGQDWNYQGEGWHAVRNYATAMARDVEVDTVFIHLPSDILITVNFWQNGRIDASIRMTPLPNQDGWCGNFNGDQSDDTLADLNLRFPAMATDDSSRLFRTRDVSFVGCYGADWDNTDFAPGDDYTVNECAISCHAGNFFVRRNGGRCYCADQHNFATLHINHVDNCNACQSNPDDWDSVFSIDNGADCVYTFKGPHREEVTASQCPDIAAAEQLCSAAHLHSPDTYDHDDCIFDACFSPGTQGEAPASKFVGCYRKGTDNFMDYAGDHKTVHGCAQACEGHEFFSRRDGEKCYCGGSPDISLHTGNGQCTRCQTEASDFTLRAGMHWNVDCVYTYDLDLTAVGNSMCPQDFPYAYRPHANFDFCCATNEDLNGNVVNDRPNRADRGNHCFGHNYHRCPVKPCADFNGR